MCSGSRKVYPAFTFQVKIVNAVNIAISPIVLEDTHRTIGSLRPMRQSGSVGVANEVVVQFLNNYKLNTKTDGRMSPTSVREQFACHKLPGPLDHHC